MANYPRKYPASLFYDIPTGGARPNEWFERPSTYLSTLGAQRRERPPVGWEDEPAQLDVNLDILNDPAFSSYDLSKIRAYEQDPMLRDVRTLGDVEGLTEMSDLASGSAGYTYPNNPFGIYDHC